VLLDFVLSWLQTFADEVLELPQWKRSEQGSCEKEMKIARQHKNGSSRSAGFKFDLYNESMRDRVTPSKESTFRLPSWTLSSS
jgi:hypothetical protein